MKKIGKYLKRKKYDDFKAYKYYFKNQKINLNKAGMWDVIQIELVLKMKWCQDLDRETKISSYKEI